MPLGEKEPAVLWVRAAPCLQQSLRELTARERLSRRDRRAGPGPVGPWTRALRAAHGSRCLCCSSPPGRAGTAAILKETWFHLETSPSLRLCRVGCPTSTSCGLVSSSTRCLSFNLGAPGSGPSSPRAATGRSHAGQSLLGACHPARPASEWHPYCEQEDIALVELRAGQVGCSLNSGSI